MSSEEPKRSRSERFESAGKRVDETVSRAAERLDQECEKLIAYVNDEVVPAIRQQSSRGLRRAAQKLADFAEHLESKRGS